MAMFQCQECGREVVMRGDTAPKSRCDCGELAWAEPSQAPASVKRSNASMSLLRRVNASRLHDLWLRDIDGNLVASEKLALAILAGGPEAEEKFRGLIDSAIEEFGVGQYRVPVRVLANFDRCLFVISAPSDADYDDAELNSIMESVRGSIKANQTPIIMLRPGCKLDVYEVGDEGGDPTFVVNGREIAVQKTAGSGGYRIEEQIGSYRYRVEGATAEEAVRLFRAVDSRNSALESGNPYNVGDEVRFRIDTIQGHYINGTVRQIVDDKRVKVRVWDTGLIAEWTVDSCERIPE